MRRRIGGGAILVSFSPEQTGIFITDSAPFAETGWFVEAREFFGVGAPGACRRKRSAPLWSSSKERRTHAASAAVAM
jgi:hypothetical protein